MPRSVNAVLCEVLDFSETSCKSFFHPASPKMPQQMIFHLLLRNAPANRSSICFFETPLKIDLSSTSLKCPQQIDLSSTSPKCPSKLIFIRFCEVPQQIDISSSPECPRNRSSTTLLPELLYLCLCPRISHNVSAFTNPHWLKLQPI